MVSARRKQASFGKIAQADPTAASRDIHAFNPALPIVRGDLSLQPMTAAARTNRVPPSTPPASLRTHLTLVWSQPAPSDPRPPHDAAFNRGILYCLNSEYQKALSSFRRAVRLMPDLVEGHIGIGLALFELKRTADALDVFDDVASRFSDRQLTEFQTALLLSARVHTLRMLRRYEEAITTADEFLKRFELPASHEIREIAIDSLLEKGFALFDLKRHEQAIDVFDSVLVVEEFSGHSAAAYALRYKGLAHAALEQHAKKIEAYDELVARFGISDESELQSLVNESLLDKAEYLFETGNDEAGSSALDLALARLDVEDHRPPSELLKRAFRHKVGQFAELDRFDAALGELEAILSRYGAAKDLASREVVAEFLNFKAIVLRGKGLREHQRSYRGSYPTPYVNPHALALLDQIVDQFGGARELSLRQWAITALQDKASHLPAGNAQIAVYDEIIDRFDSAPEESIRLTVANTFISKAKALKDLTRHGDAISVLDELITRFGNAPAHQIEFVVGNALLEKAEIIAWGRRDFEGSLSVYDELYSRFGEREESYFVHQVAEGALQKADALFRLGRREQGTAIYDELLARFAASTDKDGYETAAAALTGKWRAFGVDSKTLSAIGERMAHAFFYEHKTLDVFISEHFKEDINVLRNNGFLVSIVPGYTSYVIGEEDPPARERLPAPRRHQLKPLPEGLSWPQRDFDKSSHFGKPGGIVQYLEEVWTGIIASGSIDMRTLREHYPATAEAINNYQKPRPGSRERRRLPQHLAIPTLKELNDRALSGDWVRPEDVDRLSSARRRRRTKAMARQPEPT